MIVLGALPGRPSGRNRAIAGALLTLLFAASVTGVVFTEDTYISDGSSRWSNRGTSEHVLYVVAVTSAVMITVLLATLAMRRPNTVAIRLLLVVTGVAALVIGFAVLVAFAAN
jgi:hypothetical protein